MLRVVEQSRNRPRFPPLFIFAKADAHVTIPSSTKTSQESLLRFTRANGEERNSTNSFNVSSGEPKKSANGNKEKQTQTKRNEGTHESKNGTRQHVLQASVRVQTNVRKKKKGYKKKKLARDTTPSTRRGRRKNHRRTLHYNSYFRGNWETNMHNEKNQRPNIAQKENVENTPSAAEGIRYIPNFEKMTCVEYRMAPYYFPPKYFAFNTQDCCGTYFAEMVVECMMRSSTGGGSFPAVQGSSESGYGWGGTFWMGNSGKSGKSAGKTGKSAGKSGKSVGKSGKSWSWVNVAWGNRFQHVGAVPTEYPTNLVAGTEGFETNTPTVISPAPTASIPTHLPTPSLTAFPTTYIPTYNPTNLSTKSNEPEISTSYSPTRLAATTPIPTFYPTLSIKTPIPTVGRENFTIPTPSPTGEIWFATFVPTNEVTVPNNNQPGIKTRKPVIGRPRPKPTSKPLPKLSPKPTSKPLQKDTPKPIGGGRGKCGPRKYEKCCVNRPSNVSGDVIKRCRNCDCEEKS